MIELKVRLKTGKYIELLDKNKETEREIRVEFLKDNQITLFDCMYPEDIDYEIYVGCMEIYENTGINYFIEYRDAKINMMSNYSGIDIFDTYSRDSLIRYKNKLDKAINVMQFFCLEEFCGVRIEEYLKKLDEADKDWTNKRNERIKNKKNKDKQELEELKNKYYNFENFNEYKFDEIFEECLKNQILDNTYTLEEAMLKLNTNTEHNKSFLTFIIKDNEVCYISKSQRIPYIADKFKELRGDRILLHLIEDYYLHDIYIKSLIYFKIENPGITTEKVNKRYTSISNASDVYYKIYKIYHKELLMIIEQHKVETHIIKNTKVLNKIELDAIIRKYK